METESQRIDREESEEVITKLIGGGRLRRAPDGSLQICSLPPSAPRPTPPRTLATATPSANGNGNGKGIRRQCSTLMSVLRNPRQVLTGRRAGRSQVLADWLYHGDRADSNDYYHWGELE
jgi:hypothetical protein